MNIKELKKTLDKKAQYKWVKSGPSTWKLVNAFTLKTVYGCEDRLTATAMTRKLRSLRFVVETPPDEGVIR